MRALMLWATLAIVALGSTAQALPLYSARAGRTCDNCHSLPNTWFNPEEFWERKCTLSCMACHVDPNGGGLRTVSGRYYGENTLPLYLVEERPLDDKDAQELEAWLQALGRAEPTSGPASEASSQPTQPTSGPTSDRAFGQEPVPDAPVDPRPAGSPTPDAGPVLGRPLMHGSSPMAWLDGRYGDRSADPLLTLGGDARLGFWNPGFLLFPMQADLHLALHPIEHLTVASTMGLRGRSGGIDETAEEEVPFGVRDLWVMSHEWPLMSYLRAGRFTPGFGTRVADHTAYIRRAFGLSQEDPTNRVLGVEVGMAPNYAYMSASAFTTVLDEANPFAAGEGVGGAVSAGWRDLGWQLGASYMKRERPLEEGGDTEDVSLQWGLNPWFYSKSLPLTYLGELTWGLRERPLSGSDTFQLASYHELAWTLRPGVILRARYDFWDPDQEVIDDEIHRPGLGVDVTWLPGLTTGLDLRGTTPVGGEPNVDAFLQVHGWF